MKETRWLIIACLVAGTWLLAAGIGAAVWGEDAPPLFRVFLGFTATVLTVTGFLYGGGVAAVSGAMSHESVERGALVAGTVSGLLGSKALKDIY
jgi:CHASE2 domain-containing sensor protein